MGPVELRIQHRSSCVESQGLHCVPKRAATIGEFASFQHEVAGAGLGCSPLILPDDAKAAGSATSPDHGRW